MGRQPKPCVAVVTALCNDKTERETSFFLPLHGRSHLPPVSRGVCGRKERSGRRSTLLSGPCRVDSQRVSRSPTFTWRRPGGDGCTMLSVLSEAGNGTTKRGRRGDVGGYCG